MRVLFVSFRHLIQVIFGFWLRLAKDSGAKALDKGIPAKVALQDAPSIAT